MQGSDEDLDDDDELELIHIETMENDYNRAARVAAMYLRMVEPILTLDERVFGVLRAMPDSSGTKGDVRDIDLKYLKIKITKNPLLI